jgi:hypothetical protein
MAWSTPRTWVAGELVTASLMNQFIRDQQLFLHDNPVQFVDNSSGTDNNAGAANVDSMAISGLSVFDFLLVNFSIESATQATANVVLRNSTDTVDLVSLTAAGALGAGAQVSGRVMICARPGSTTLIRSTVMAFGSATVDNGANVTFTTAWTGAWNLALRHNGVTGGGTFSYMWTTHILKGQ